MNIDWSDVTDIRDLIVNLRAQNYDLTDRAADEIERLREEVARLKAVQAPAKVGEDEREAFEEWVRDELGNDGDLCKRSQCGYAESNIDSAWLAWQRRASHAETPLEPSERYALDSADAAIAAVHLALDLPEEDAGGVDAILEAIEELKRRAALSAPVEVGRDEREAYIASLPADWHKDSSLETWFPLTAEELAATKRMFGEACTDLGRVNKALGLDPDDAGAEPIIDAIDELKARAALSADGGEDKRDAELWRFLREQHEGTESFKDAEGFTITEPTAQAFTVFKPGQGDYHLEPVGCMPGELEKTIRAAIAANQSGKGGE